VSQLSIGRKALLTNSRTNSKRSKIGKEIAYVIDGLKAGKVNKSWLPIIMIGNFGNVISSPDS
jgi:hypothetical protein